MTGYSASWQQLIDMADTDRGRGTPGWRASGVHGAVGGHGTPGGRLKHSDDAWTAAAGATDELRSHLGQVKPDFATAHAGVAAGTQGLDVAGALGAVRGSWEQRIDTAIGECTGLGLALRAVVRDQGENEAATRSSFAGSRAGRAGAGAGAHG
jgi:hypothetical protein